MDFGSGTARYGFIDRRPIDELPTQSVSGLSCFEAFSTKKCLNCETLAYRSAVACQCGAAFSFTANLNVEAQQGQLLSSDIHVAQVLTEIVSANDSGWKWTCELRDGTRLLRAVNFSLTRPTPRFVVGASVLVERMGGSDVRILCAAT